MGLRLSVPGNKKADNGLLLENQAACTVAGADGRALEREPVSLDEIRDHNLQYPMDYGL